MQPNSSKSPVVDKKIGIKNKVIKIFKDLTPHQIRRYLPLLIITLAIPLTVVLALTQQDFFNRASGLPATPATPPFPEDGYKRAMKITPDQGIARIPNSINLGNFTNLTIEAVINYSKKPGNFSYPIISKGFTAGEILPYQLEINAEGKLHFIHNIFYSGSWQPNEITSTVNVAEGVPNHVAVVYNNIPGSSGNGKMSLFINGRKVAEKALSGEIGGESHGLVTIGYGAHTYFNGTIDELRISNTPKYLNGFSQTSPFEVGQDTLALYKFDNSDITDSAGNYNGEIAGGNVEFVPSIPSPFVFTSDQNYFLQLSENPIILTVGDPSYTVWSLLKREVGGDVVTDQSNLNYSWSVDDPNVAQIAPFIQCTNGIVPPCPADHSEVVATHQGSSQIDVNVTDKTTGGLVAANSFDLTVNFPTPSPTPPVEKKIIFNPTDDAYVSADSPTKNFGGAVRLRTDTSPKADSYLKFNLAPLAGKKIVKAVLRVRVANNAESASTGTQSVRQVGNTAWTQSTITYSNRPALGNLLSSKTSVAQGTDANFNVLSWVNLRKGLLSSFAITSNSMDEMLVNSREAQSLTPQLIVTYTD